MNNTHEFFFEQLQKYELDTLDGWREEYRGRLIAMFSPLFQGTEYYLEKNERDKGANGRKRITDLFENGEKRRRMAFEHKIRADSENKRIISWFNKAFYEDLSPKMEFPDLRFEKKGQIYVYFTIKGLWNLMCVICGKEEFTAE